MQDAVIFYFSGTGNTAWTAKKIAAALTARGIAAETHSIEQVAPDEIRPLIRGRLYVGFGYPVYGSDLPEPMKEFIIRFPALRQKKVFCFCTQEAFSGDGARAIKPFLWHSKAKIIYAEHFFMPNNISIERYGFHATNDENVITPVLREAQRKAEAFAETIKNDVRVRRGFHIGSHLLGAVQRVPFRAVFPLLKKSFSIDEAVCTRCGKCARYCPVGNIRMDDGGYRIGTQCCLCLRCYNYCDSGAVLFRGRRAASVPYKGVDGFEDELRRMKDRTHYTRDLPKPKDKRIF